MPATFYPIGDGLSIRAAIIQKDKRSPRYRIALYKSYPGFTLFFRLPRNRSRQTRQYMSEASAIAGFAHAVQRLHFLTHGEPLCIASIPTGPLAGATTSTTKLPYVGWTATKGIPPFGALSIADTAPIEGVSSARSLSWPSPGPARFTPSLTIHARR